MGPALLGPQPTQPVMNIATPINDIQLVAVMACLLNEPTVGDRVNLAMDVLAESVLQMQDFGALLRRKQSERLEGN